MTKRFGKYRSRKKGGGVRVAGSVAKEKAKAGAGFVENAAKVVKKVKRAVKTAAPIVNDAIDIYEKAAPVVKRVAKSFETKQVKQGGFFQNVHDAMHKQGFHRAAHDISEITHHGFRHLKAAAAHVLGEAHDVPILRSHHQVNAASHHFRRILNSSKADLQKAVGQNPQLRDAVSDAMHIAEKGGGIQWHHEVGGGFSDIVKVARQIGDPIKEVAKAKGAYDEIDMHDWSARGMLKNYVTGVAGNAHVAAAHMKAANIASMGLGSAELLPASNAFGAVGDGLQSVAHEI